MIESILIERDGPIATVVLNRPDKLNALTRAMWGELGETVEPLHLLGRDIAIGRPVRDFAAEVDSEVFRAKQRDAVNSTFTAAHSLPQVFYLAAKRSDCANACYDDAANH